MSEPSAVGVARRILAFTGLEHEEGFAALGHPGFRHFMRIRIDPDGRFDRSWSTGPHRSLRVALTW